MILQQLGDLMYGTTNKNCYNSTDISNRTKSGTGIYMRLPSVSTEYFISNNPLELSNDTLTNAIQGSYYGFNFGVVLGGGGTPPTVNDYKLENRYNYNQFQLISKSGNFNNSQITLTITVKNITEENISVQEVGIACNNNNTSTMNTGRVSLLLTRSVLTQPVVIQPEEIKTFTASIDLNKFIDNTTNT